MKCTILVIALALFSVLPASAADSKKAVLTAIATIESSGNAESFSKATRVVLNFADKSPDVLILGSPESAPWIYEDLKLSKDQNEAVSTILMASYVAGSVKYQLELGKADPNPYYGWLLALKKYQVLKKNFAFTSPGMEKLAALEAAGKLQAYGTELAAKAKH